MGNFPLGELAKQLRLPEKENNKTENKIVLKGCADKKKNTSKQNKTVNYRAKLKKKYSVSICILTTNIL